MATAYPGGLRKRGGLLDYEDTIKATPRNAFFGGVADLLGQAYKLPEMPRLGVPGLDFVAANRNRLMDMLMLGDVQKTAETMSYGFPVSTGRGMTYQPKEETINAAMALAPMVAPAARMIGEGAMATGRFVAPKAGLLAENYMQRMGTMPSIVPAESGGLLGPSMPAMPVMPIKPVAEVSPSGFYSAVEQQALNIPRKSGTGASFLNDLMKGQDVKKYEIEAMGLDQFLAGKPNVTKQEVQDFIQSNRVNVQEKKLGNVIPEDPIGMAARKAVFEKYDPQIQALSDEYSVFNKALDEQTMLARDNWANAHARLNTQGYTPTAQDYEAYNLADAELKSVRLMPRKMGEFQQKVNNLKDIRDAEADAAYVVPRSPLTKYEKFQLPGGENYREILLTTPVKGKAELDAAQITAGDLRLQTANLMEQWKSASELNPGDPSVVALYQKVAESRKLRDQAENKAQELKNQINQNTYQSSHFNEPNLLAHMRVNDRIDADGKKMLLVEEVQSDWHQAGREKGYKGKGILTELPSNYFVQEIKTIDGDTMYVVRDNSNPGVVVNKDYNKQSAINGVINELNASTVGGVPDAPFKDTWYQLALKRAIKEAVDKGYDRIGLTTGKQQIDRFSDELRQNVDEINFNPIGTQNEITVNAKKNGKNTFSGTIKDGKFIDGSAQGKTAEEVLGKTMAKQITEKKDGVIKGDDLTIGGEGMKKYYDEVYPAFLEKQGKKYGAKVGETKINSGKVQSKDELAAQVYGQGMTYRNLPSEQKRKIDEMGFGKGEQSIRYLDITPEMRKAVQKGQPLASISSIDTGLLA